MSLTIDKSVSDDILTLDVYLSDASGNKYAIFGEDETITVEVGLFADFLPSGRISITPDSTDIVPGINYYREFTFTHAASTLTFRLDLAKLRNNLNLNKAHKIPWGGSEPVMFSCRAVNGDVKESSEEYLFYVAPNDSDDSTLNYMGELQPAIWVNSTTRQPYSLNADVMSNNGKGYYKINMLPIISRNDSIGGDWMNAFNNARRFGVGDYETPVVEFSDITFVMSCVKAQIADKENILYYYNSSNSFVSMGGTMRHYESGS